MAEVVLPVGLMVIMGLLGLTLTPADFRRVVTQPRGVLLGLANLFFVAPLLGFAVAELFGLDPVFAAGLVLLAAAPGGTMANLLTHFARGDTALSVSMTALSSVAAVVTVPVYLGLAVAHFDAPVEDDVAVASVVLPVFAITIVPLALGMLTRARRPEQVLRQEGRAKVVAGVAFGVIVLAVVVSESETVLEHLDVLAAATLTLNILAMGLSFGLSRLARLDMRQSTAVAMELGVHNAALAIAVGSLLSDELTVPAAVYSSFMLTTAAIFAKLVHRRNAAEPAPAPA